MRIRDEHKEKLVIQKAIELIVTDGFQGFSMNKLAKACKISVATLYIYYADKDDLIRRIGTDIARNFFESTLEGFSADMNFEAGLRKQWENRTKFSLDHPLEVECFEIIKHSSHGEHAIREHLIGFKQKMGDFMKNAVAKKQLVPLSIEVYWSIAYGPLYTLLRFEADGKSMGGQPFKLTETMFEEALQSVIKALKP